MMRCLDINKAVIAVFLQILLYFSCNSYYTAYADSTCQQDVCWDCGHFTDQLEVVCPEQHVVTGELKVGWRTINLASEDCATPPELDCVDAATSPESLAVLSSCLWKESSCVFNKVFGTAAYCSNVYPKYLLFFNFKCIKRSNLFQLCTRDRPPQPKVLDTNTSNIHYLVSPGYEIPYMEYLTSEKLLKSRTYCIMDITTDTPGYGIHISSVFMDINLEDTLVVYYNHVEHKYKGIFGFELFVPYRTLSVSFEIKVSEERFHYRPHKGFLLEYHSYSLHSITNPPEIVKKPPDFHRTPITTQAPPPLHPTDSDQEKPEIKETYEKPSSDTLRPRIMVFFLFLMVIIFSGVLLCAIFFMVRSSMDRTKEEPSLEEEPDSLSFSDEQLEFPFRHSISATNEFSGYKKPVGQDNEHSMYGHVGAHKCACNYYSFKAN